MRQVQIWNSHNNTAEDFRRSQLFSAARAMPPKIRLFLAGVSVVAENNTFFANHLVIFVCHYFRRPMEIPPKITYFRRSDFGHRKLISIFDYFFPSIASGNRAYAYFQRHVPYLRRHPAAENTLRSSSVRASSGFAIKIWFNCRCSSHEQGRPIYSKSPFACP